MPMYYDIVDYLIFGIRFVRYRILYPRQLTFFEHKDSKGCYSYISYLQSKEYTELWNKNTKNLEDYFIDRIIRKAGHAQFL